MHSGVTVFFWQIHASFTSPKQAHNSEEGQFEILRVEQTS
jgi:hypothetical protein